MSYRVIVKPKAERELLDAARFYESKRKHAGLGFYDCFDDLVLRLADQPRAYPEVIPPYRTAPLQKFPYSIFYLIEEKKVFIVAAWHQSRDPQSLDL